MITIPFDVNDRNLRIDFFHRTLTNAVAELKESTPALWGAMSAQHMLEHLTWAFRCSTGALVLRCHTPANLLERSRRFLYDSRPTPRLFKNPELGNAPPNLEFSGFPDARRALCEEIVRFNDHCDKHPDALHIHPIFGPLDTEGWQRSHFKHCYHHLLQFGLVKEITTDR